MRVKPINAGTFYNKTPELQTYITVSEEETFDAVNYDRNNVRLVSIDSPMVSFIMPIWNFRKWFKEVK